MASVITIAGEQLFAAKAQANEQLDIDTFIFANVPNQDPNAPINREEGIPTAHIVYQQNVQQVGRINDNVVVYSTVLDSITGPFEFNWVGLYSSVNQKLVAINHVPTVTKTATAPGAAGNTLNRNFGIEYSGIAELTGISVEPETWQLDFTARLSGMDKLTQQLASDMNGKDWFIDDGLKVVPRATANSFSVTPGVGYVSGLRVELKQEHILIVQSYPQFVYVDAWFSGNANSTWSPQLAFTVTNTEMDDYIDPSGTQHYVYKLAIINSDDEIIDLRTSSKLKQLKFKSVSKMLEYIKAVGPVDGIEYIVNKDIGSISNDDLLNGVFVYEKSISKTEHDGGIIIDYERDLPFDFNNKSEVYNWLSPSNNGYGVIVRQNVTSVMPEFWGAKCDFNKVTGLGTKNMPMIQAAINFVQKNNLKEIIFQNGSYFLDDEYKPDSNSNLTIQLLIGSITSEQKQRVSGIHLIGNNTKLYAGKDGRMLTIANAEDVKVCGFTFIHWVGGLIHGLRGLNDNAIRICDSSYDVEIFDCYLTNHLGWGIDITSNAEDPASNNYMCKKIKIHHCKIKTRFGNGKRAYNTLDNPEDEQGTGGAWCIAVINGEDIDIFENELIGNIDLENNNVNQTFKTIKIIKNKFRSGWVTPQEIIGNDFWHDEQENERGTAGTEELMQGVLFNGVGLNTIPEGIACNDNEFEKALFKIYANYRMSIRNNKGNKGKIEVGYEQNGEQITYLPDISFNDAEQPLYGDSFISIKGIVQGASIKFNSIRDVSNYNTISLDNVSGRNYMSDNNYLGNKMKSGIPLSSGKYKVRIKPFMTPTCTLNTSVFLWAGAGSGIISHLCGGNYDSINTFNVVKILEESANASVSFSDLTKLGNGEYQFYVTVASAGEISFSSTDSYAIVSVDKEI
ncbi:phage tail-collar fiber domain-containing protein [Shewanella xiamenensis]|uniref:phage tail-collar fiber domain-containing protein n=1 Tax=Shewanella xiamenensis TaxID=332186 RepID=UPI0004D512D1|nr:phage tail protein [Shewanella xiamenensis]KEK29141.1 hypothetical protein SXM_1299 [Shewanella xiamenensis]